MSDAPAGTSVPASAARPVGRAEPLPLRTIAKFAAFAGVGVACLSLASAIYFTVQPNERAFVTQFGRVVGPGTMPLQPGLHFKFPLFTSVDKISVSIDVMDLGNIDAFTRDAQKVSMHVTVTSQVPDDAVYHLLYEVGRSGNIDLEKNYTTIIADRLRTVVGRHDITELAGADRQRIVDEVRAVLSQDLKGLFGIKIDSVQVALVGMSPSYSQAIEAALQARTQRQAAEQNQARARIEAETAKVRASGEADAAIEAARGAAQSQVLRSQADAQAVRLRGQAEADAAMALAKALESNAGIVQMRVAERWNGVLPQNIYAGAPIPFLPMPPVR